MIAIGLALITSLATVIGGLLPLNKRVSRIEFRYLVAFAAGATVSIAFFDLIPEAFARVGVFDGTMVAVGFFSLYVIEKFVLVHACGEEECETHTIGWVALIGIGAESLIDGLAIGVGYSVEPELGLLLAGAVLLHEVPRGFATTVIMKQANYGLKGIAGALVVDAGLTPVGALFANFLPETLFAPLVAYAAGAFLYVGASDLLPEAHRRFNSRVIFSLMFGAAFIPAIGSLLGV